MGGVGILRVGRQMCGLFSTVRDRRFLGYKLSSRFRINSRLGIDTAVLIEGFWDRSSLSEGGAFYYTRFFSVI